MSLIAKKLLSWFYPVRVETTQGELKHILEVNLYRGKMYLDTAYVNYSFGALQEVFDHAFKSTELYDQDIRSALILGYGSGSVAELLLTKCNYEMNITGVEADSEVIRLAHAYFPVNGNPKITIIHQDAVKFVESERNRYNLIVVDLFVEDQVPGDCQSLEFLSRLRHLLSENGKVYFNQMNLIHDTDGATTLVRNFETTFQSTRNINVYRGGAGNRVLIRK